MNTFLWGMLPYACITLLIGGTIWRYRHDQFGWTTRSSQLYESKILKIASPMFHFGLLFVIMGHFMGLVIPKSWTDAIGFSQHAYHTLAMGGGLVAAVATVLGLAGLVYRRRTTAEVFSATTRNDKLMYVVLVAAIVFGMIATLTPYLRSCSSIGVALGSMWRDSSSRSCAITGLKLAPWSS